MRVMTWNVGFGTRKDEYGPGPKGDSRRALEIMRLIFDLDPHVVALQEMATRVYKDGHSFDLGAYLRAADPGSAVLHFEPAVSLGPGHRQSNPYGKLNHLDLKNHEEGPGLWIRRPFGIRNLASTEAGDQEQATVEITRPCPQRLYIGSKPSNAKEHSSGRDEQDRPVLWARVDRRKDQARNALVFAASLHLPTLRNEEAHPPCRDLTEVQKDILAATLGLGSIANVDRLASHYRVYYLRHVLSQVNRLESYWKGRRCVFVLAGDFNFEHTAEPPERYLLQESNFKPVRTEGATRPGGRLVDNIWVRGAKAVQVDNPRNTAELDPVSDHYPVIADLTL